MDHLRLVRSVRFGTGLLGLMTALLLWGGAMAYDKYADDTAPDPLTTNCAACHGDFNSGT
jgi:hypothetical protein